MSELTFASIVSANLLALREERGLSYAQAAKLCGVSQRTWYYWEREPRGQSLGGAIDGIAEAFDVPVARLLYTNGDQPHKKPGPKPPADSIDQPPKQKPDKRTVNPFIPCGCGCGKFIRKFDERGKSRQFAAGHRRRKNTKQTAVGVRRSVRREV